MHTILLHCNSCGKAVRFGHPCTVTFFRETKWPLKSECASGRQQYQGKWSMCFENGPKISSCRPVKLCTPPWRWKEHPPSVTDSNKVPHSRPISEAPRSPQHWLTKRRSYWRPCKSRDATCLGRSRICNSSRSLRLPIPAGKQVNSLQVLMVSLRRKWRPWISGKAVSFSHLIYVYLFKRLKEPKILWQTNQPGVGFYNQPS